MSPRFLKGDGFLKTFRKVEAVEMPSAIRVCSTQNWILQKSEVRAEAIAF
ncbi:MAG: hypothetical protein KME25_30930 [Symplocastrum torsivum CPER-KK1]|uniref:Uncharacterized protein n=1 Tax=Symplocastrum torsivum CPER-KK1 TaxID=450513 RepID=A0A951PT69_9CYAN|nr:hypothetical protein [Symplocastrum torsivum CPER-KK1]